MCFSLDLTLVLVLKTGDSKENSSFKISHHTRQLQFRVSLFLHSLYNVNVIICFKKMGLHDITLGAFFEKGKLGDFPMKVNIREVPDIQIKMDINRI